MDREDYIRIIRRMAKDDGISIEEEEKRLQEMIDELFCNMNEEILKDWEKLLGVGRSPTVEEFLRGMASMPEKVHNGDDSVVK